MPISISIDVTKIDKGRLKEGKNGQKYLALTLIDTPNSQYGDHFMVVHSSKKEERDAGYQSEILGNGKDWDREEGQARRPQQQQDSRVIPAPSTPEEQDDIPF